MNEEAFRKLGTLARRWRDLAERRRADFTELYESGRWKKYYSEDRLLLRMREVVKSAEGWQRIAACFEPENGRPPEAASSSEGSEQVLNSPRRAA